MENITLRLVVMAAAFVAFACYSWKLHYEHSRLCAMACNRRQCWYTMTGLRLACAFLGMRVVYLALLFTDLPLSGTADAGFAEAGYCIGLAMMAAGWVWSDVPVIQSRLKKRFKSIIGVWTMRKFSAVLLVVLLLAQLAAASDRGRRRGQVCQGGSCSSGQCTDGSCSVTVPTPAPKGASLAEQATGADALSEVNAARASRGLRPYVNDSLLNQAAQAAAKARAACRCAGHTQNDFSYVPSGGWATSAGCAAWEPSWGWGACCTYDHYTYAGAAWAMGSDGKRYMHLFVR